MLVSLTYVGAVVAGAVIVLALLVLGDARQGAARVFAVTAAVAVGAAAVVFGSAGLLLTGLGWLDGRLERALASSIAGALTGGLAVFAARTKPATKSLDQSGLNHDADGGQGG